MKKSVIQRISRLQETGKSVNKKRIIMKVFKVKFTGQLMCTIPKDSDIREGDYIEILKLSD